MKIQSEIDFLLLSLERLRILNTKFNQSVFIFPNCKIAMHLLSEDTVGCSDVSLYTYVNSSSNSFIYTYIYIYIHIYIFMFKINIFHISL